MKQYNKTNWIDRVVQYPNRYKDQDNNVITLTQDPGEVAKEGTRVKAEYMNNIEDGVEEMFKNRTFSFTESLIVDNWTENSSTGYYEYDIIRTDVTPKTVVNGVLDIDNMGKLSSSITKSYNGGFKVITVDEPKEDVDIVFNYALSNYDEEIEMIGVINSGIKDKGLAPKNVTNLRVKTGDKKVTVFWNDPEDSVIEGDITICKWAGTKLVYKVGAYPQDEKDGIIVVDNTVRNQYATDGFEIDNLVNDTTYYFALFPYSDTGAVNISADNMITAVPQEFHIFGIKRQITSSSTSWTRTDDAEGLVANAQVGLTPVVQNDFDNIYPWSDIITCNVLNGNIVAYLGDPNFSFTGSNGDVMTKIPEFWWKRWQEGGYEFIQISQSAVDGFNHSAEFLIGRYTMSGSTSGVFSKSGVSPFTNKTISNYRIYAKNKNTGGVTGWQQLDWHYFLIQFLYLVEYADYDCQVKLGGGFVDGNSSPVSSGGCNDLGMKSGVPSGGTVGKKSVIYRGIEDIFGNIWQFVDGINLSSRQAYICYDPNKYASDKFNDGYTSLSYSNRTSDGYIKKLGYDSNNPLISFPIEAGGSSITHIPDYYYQNTGNLIALVGGNWGVTSNAGLWCWGLNYSSSYTYSNIGARLLKTS